MRVSPSIALNSIFTAASLAMLALPAPVAAGPLEDLKPGEWYEVPDSHLDAVKPNPVPPGNPQAVMDAWSGGAFDGKRGRLLVWGGGHGDYSGNELYAFDVESLKWSRLSAASTDVGGDEKSGTYPDGLPRSRHTYNSIQYLPGIDRFCAFGAAGMYPSGQLGTARTDCFDFATSKWVRMADTKTNGIANFSAYDPVSGALWAGKGTLTRFDPANDSWGKQTEFDNDIEWTNYLTLEADPDRRLLVAVGAGHTYTYDISNTVGPIVPKALATKGDTTIEAAGGPGLAYDPVGKRITGWAGGGDVFTLDIGDNRWTRHARTGGATPTAANANCTYGRFRYVPSKHVFIAVNRTAENVFFYKLSAGTGASFPKPRKAGVTPTPDPAGVRDAEGRSGSRNHAGPHYRRVTHR